MRWRYKIDLTTYENPLEWQNAEVIIERDSDLPGGIFTAFQTEVIWRGDAYDYLITAYDTDSWCGVFDVELSYVCDGVFTELGAGFKMFGNEFEIDRRKCTIKAILHEDTYAAQISANKKIPFACDAGESKSGASITPVTDEQIDMFDPSAVLASYGYPNRELYKVYNVLNYAVQFMTDGAMTCDAIPFGALGDHPGLCIGTGEAIRQNANEAPPITDFETLYNELRIRYNLGFYMVGTVLTIDYLDNIYSGSTGVTLADVYEIKETFKSEIAYSKVRIGTGTNQKTESGTFAWPDARLFNFFEEEYYVDYLCNVDQELDLVGEYVASSNVIEDVLVTPNDEYDDDIFLVETDLSGATTATKYDEFNIGAPPYVYNVGLTNREILNRFAGAIPNDLRLMVGNGDDGFRAAQTTVQSQSGLGTPFVKNPLEIDDDSTAPNNDPNGNYDTVAYDYTAPADGFYRFDAQITVNFTPSGVWQSWDFKVEIQLFDSLATLLDTREYEVLGSTTNETSTHANEPGFYMVAGDYVNVKVTCTPQGGPGPGGPTFDIIGGLNNWFTALEFETGGGSYAGFDPDEYRIINLVTRAPLSVPDFVTILSNPQQSIALSWIGQNGTRTNDTGFIDKLTYDVEQQAVEVTLVKSRS